jgi:pyrroline-5-carboxylate reductase
MIVVMDSGPPLRGARNDREALMSTLKDFSATLVLVGAGKMGGAMLDGWLALGLDPAKVAVMEPRPSDAIAALAARGVRLNPSSVTDARVIVIAIKPQDAAAVVPSLKPLAGANTVAVSIMAGSTLRFLQGALPDNLAIVRAMPNTPAAIGRGITVAVPNARVTADQRAVADALLGAVGAVEWVSDETLLDAVTAVSGSGPAYVFLLAESLARAGAAAGLPADLATRLARATVSGAGELLHRAAVDAATLRANVTSRGGTTAAALGVLMADDGLDPLMQKAIAAATKRSRELAG